MYSLAAPQECPHKSPRSSVMSCVISGLAVVTMCVDLASSHLKAYFTKIHYFGRARSRFLGMSEDIREMMQLIAAMRKKKGGNVTWSDVRDYLKYEQQLTLRPFTPGAVHTWRYIDETSSAISFPLYRRSSLTSDAISASLASGRRTSRASTLRNVDWSEHAIANTHGNAHGNIAL